ncbi:ANTAR domain-containing response regulator [Pantoea phytobeneficialis]|uniref:ANTAR domain-containing protein n=1 Tax=Pantoea phytobeneficialis TaxID=2052056 RepID=A0AAP9H993_9GAMM|nr:ANTAR domain-containing protein [Pantoea phytobeneficialis]MDO6408773.1 ANTAR domain-containing protein [Pantoea phytobeneficialis]QGR09018.1 antitermination regulator [Pantoea phytobeneficialis]
MTEQSLLARLSGVRLHLFHPDAQSVRAFCASLTQLGCQAQHSWPLPTQAPTDVHLVIVAVEPHYQQTLLPLLRAWRQANIPVIALADCQNARLFPLLIELQPTAIAERTLNPFALIVQVIGTLQATRQHARQRVKVKSERLAQAKGMLMREYGLDESGAYRFMRSEAMNTRSSMEYTAERVINSLQK